MQILYRCRSVQGGKLKLNLKSLAFMLAFLALLASSRAWQVGREYQPRHIGTVCFTVDIATQTPRFIHPLPFPPLRDTPLDPAGRVAVRVRQATVVEAQRSVCLPACLHRIKGGRRSQQRLWQVHVGLAPAKTASLVPLLWLLPKRWQ